MTQTREFLRIRPDLGGGPAPEALATCLERLAACVQACTACADACLAERGVDMAACIRLNLDCAAVCAAAEAVLTRRSAHDGELARTLLGTAAAFCRACAEECGRHAERSEHCMLCRDVCLLCEDACRMLAAGAREPAAQSG